MDGGFVINHYRYCEANYYKIEHIVCVVSVFGVCLARRKLGYAEFRPLTSGRRLGRRDAAHAAQRLGAEAHHRWLQDPRHGFGADAIAEFDFETRIDFVGQVEETEGNSYRCDSAQYLLGRRGCMFHKVDLIFSGLDLARGSDNQAEAVHVWEAFYAPALTKPSHPTKQIPGNARQRSQGGTTPPSRSTGNTTRPVAGIWVTGTPTDSGCCTSWTGSMCCW